MVFFHGWLTEMERTIDKKGQKLFKLLFSSDKTLVLSEQYRRALIRWGFRPHDIIRETTTFEHHRQDGASKDPLKILFLSRLVKEKGCMEAVQSIELLIRQFPGIRLYVAGDGEMSARLRGYVSSHGLGDNVEFTGWLDGPGKYSLLAECGIMLLPTYSEGMPISLLEGMGMGLAVVTRPVGGIPDFFVDGENGFLVPSLNPNDFADKIRYLLQHHDMWRSISEKNIVQAEEKFEIRNVSRRLEQLYFEVASR